MSEPDTKQKQLNALVSDIEKTYGKGSITRFSEIADINVPKISTGSFGLDQALLGGFPTGRIVEIYGPEASSKTTLALETIADVHKNSETDLCAFIDMEHAFDPVYASNLGVDLDRLYFSQPSSGEEALGIAEKLVTSNNMKVIVVDSVAALVPQAEIDKDYGESNMGLHARLMSQACRKLTPLVNGSDTLMIFINQIRHKIGVIFGCFHYNAKVLLADGTTEKIGKIVNQKLDLEVMSYNDKTQQIEPRKIVSYFNNGKANQFYQLVVKNPHGSGRSNLPIGDDHLIPTPNGEKYFSDLKVGDEVYIQSKVYLNDEQRQIALGMFLGDSSIRTTNNLTYSLRQKHGLNQNEYCEFKRSIFPEPFISSQGYDSEGRFWFDSKRTAEFSTWAFSKLNTTTGVKEVSQHVIDELTLISLAFWYLDDGGFYGSYAKWGKGKTRIYTTCMSQNTRERFCDRFEKLNLPRPSLDAKGFIWYGKDSYAVHEVIAKYIPKCMHYKLHPKLRDIPKHIYSTENTYRTILIPTPIIDIYKKPNSKQTLKFDIEVEGNHNYFVDNVLVHNSPETTTGGNALKFYSSVRIEMRGSTHIKDGLETTGVKVKAKVVKSKVSPPFKKVEFDVAFGEGIQYEGEVFDAAVEAKVITKGGSWYSYGDMKLGQGRDNALALVKDNPEMVEEIKQRILHPEVEE